MNPKVIVALLVTAIQIQGAHAQSSVGNFLTGGATVEVVEHDGAAQVVPKPERVVIHDFAVRIDAVTLDNSIAGRLHRDRLMRHGTDEDSTPDVLAKHVRSVFSKALAEQLEKDHVASASAASAAVAAAEGGGARLVVDGEFTAIDEGNKTKRKLIGFGSGASDIKTHVAVSSMVAGHSTVVLAIDLDSNSGRAPGKVATMGINSQAVGTAVGALGMTGTTVDADATRMAKLVAMQIESLINGPKAAASPAASPAAETGGAPQAGRSAG